MAAAQINVKVTPTLRKSFFDSAAKVNDAIASKWIQNAVFMREPFRKQIDATSAKAVCQIVVNDLLANAQDEAQKAAAMAFINEKGEVKTLQSYWSEVNQAEKNTGVHAVINRGGKSITFAAKEKPYVIWTRDEIQALNKLLAEGAGQTIEKDGKRWSLTINSDGSSTPTSVTIVKTPAPTPPVSGQSGSSTAPVKTAEEEAKDRFAEAARTIVRSVKTPDGSFRQFDASEQRVAALALKSLAQALEAQTSALDDSGLKAVIAAMKAVREIPQIKVMVAK